MTLGVYKKGTTWGQNYYSSMEDQREKFEAFCKEKFSATSTSKTITKEKGEHIKGVLTGELTSADASFKHWVIKKGFKLIDYPLLGLKQVLCLPAKKKVHACYCAYLWNKNIMYIIRISYCTCVYC